MTLELTEEQRTELLVYEDGKPRRVVSGRPNRNLIRRNLLTRAPASGDGFYRITEAGLAALKANRRFLISHDSTEPQEAIARQLRDCIEKVVDAGRFDLLEDLLVGLGEILRRPERWRSPIQPSPPLPSRSDRDG